MNIASTILFFTKMLLSIFIQGIQHTIFKRSSDIKSGHLKIFVAIFLLAANIMDVDAQVGINTNESAPESSAMLDVKSTDKGVLVPRMTTGQRTNISNPAVGLLVFDTNTESFWYKSSSSWFELLSDNFDSIVDSDEDTKVQVEESVDEDIIRFDLEGTEYFRMNKGRLEVLNSGMSTFIGENAGKNDDLTDNENIAIGHGALQNNSSGASNTVVGAFSLANNTGNENNGFGYSTLSLNTSGVQNTAIGSDALLLNTTGNRNTALGNFALGLNSTGNNNTALGFQANVGSGNLSNTTTVGARAFATKSNSLILGSIAGVNLATSSTNVGIGTTAPDTKFHLVGKMKYQDGSQQNGHILTSDADGNTSWQGTFNGDVIGNLTGDVTGDVIGNVTGNLTGDVTGNLTGDVTGNLVGNVTGDVIGNLAGDVNGNVTGDLTGNLTGDVTGDVTGNVTGNLTGNVSGGTVQVGNTSVINGMIRRSVFRDVGSINGNNSRVEIFTVNGASTLGVVHVSANGQLQSQVVIAQAWVSDMDEVSIRFRNTDSGSQNPDGSGLTYRIVVIQ